MENNQVVEYISLEKLKPNSKQPRKYFDEAELTELENSIKEKGMIYPIIAEKETEDGKHVIIDGERRYRAAENAKLLEVPVILRKSSDKERERMIVSLIANIQRSNLNSIEEAEAYQQIIDNSDKNISPKELADMVGKDRTTIVNTLRLLKLSPELQKYLRENKLSAGHARAILSVIDSKNQKTLFTEIIKRNLSVRAAEGIAKELNENKPVTASLPQKMDEIETELIKFLDTKVSIINEDDDKGTIMIKYFSRDDCRRLYDIIISSQFAEM